MNQKTRECINTMKINTNTTFQTHSYNNAASAFARIKEIYDTNIAYLREAFAAFERGEIPDGSIRACYPYAQLHTPNAHREDTRLSYGFVPLPGTYATTVTRPDIFDHYYQHQLALLITNHGVVIEVGESTTPIPIHFALGEDFHLEADLSREQMRAVARVFDHPHLEVLDDEVPNGTHVGDDDAAEPLSLFSAPRVDVSLMRLRHYTGTSAGHFQNYVIYTNYQFYIDEFVRMAYALMQKQNTDNDELPHEDPQEYAAFIEPGNKITYNRNLYGDDVEDAPGQTLRRMPQMPAYHLQRSDGTGITMINIGVGPSNAKTITDHVAVLRPHAWLMLGHCAGLRNSQGLGDYVLAHGYLREDNVLSEDLPTSIPIPPLAEIQLALEEAVATITGYQGYDLKTIMRTGTVATIDDRNWEFRSSTIQNRRFSQSRAIALDMESGTIAANGFRFRVPYGTLLCVSDKPLHGQLKLPGMAESFYRQRVEQHLQVGLLTMKLLRDIGPERLHSRKLRSFNEVAFQ
jgi:AMP nucleosidase